MNYRELRHEAESFYPAWRLETRFGRYARHLTARVLEWAAAILLVGGVIIDWRFGAQTWLGGFLLVLVLWAIADLLNAFYNSYYYGSFKSETISFAVAGVVFALDEKDVTKSLFVGRLGRLILLRLGLTLSDWEKFLAERQGRVSATLLELADGRVDLPVFGRALWQRDQSLADFLFARGLQESDWLGVLGWIERERAATAARERWWGRERLARVPSIGKDWAYGQTRELEKYASPLPLPDSPPGLGRGFLQDEVRRLESVLVRARGANALLIGADDLTADEVLLGLGQEIASGHAVPTLEAKQIFILDGEQLLALAETGPELERLIDKLLAEALAAGNVIIAFKNFPAWFRGAAALGVDVPSLLGPFLASPASQFIGLCRQAEFEKFLRAESGLLEHFELVEIREQSRESLLGFVEAEVAALESRSGIFFTYPGLVAALDSAERYWPQAAPADKALDLLLEVVPILAAAGRRLVLPADIAQLVTAKTNVPTGEPQSAERAKLLGLEAKLKKRVVGQAPALEAVAAALRRARAGVTNPARPLGSFLFLGPTGVGKTETARALADSFFGGEATMIRFDLTEFAGPDGLAKMIGAAGRGDGLLAERLRAKPYGVLLLDEFEKAAVEVRDLFLQILDEGRFSDGAGQPVNAHNLIIIATSNAGSDLIWQINARGETLADHRDEILAKVIERGALKPELLNRFDSVVFYRPLGPVELTAVTKLLLGKLQKRLQKRGFKLVVDEPLIQFLVARGTDPQFGARPINRAIQDTVERAIADQILQANLAPGATIHLDPTKL